MSFIVMHCDPLATKNYLFKVNNRDTGEKCEICSKLKIKTPERILNIFHNFNIFHIMYSIVFIVDFEHIKIRWVTINFSNEVLLSK